MHLTVSGEPYLIVYNLMQEREAYGITRRNKMRG